MIEHLGHSRADVSENDVSAIMFVPVGSIEGVAIAVHIQFNKTLNGMALTDEDHIRVCDMRV